MSSKEKIGYRDIFRQKEYMKIILACPLFLSSKVMRREKDTVQKTEHVQEMV